MSGGAYRLIGARLELQDRALTQLVDAWLYQRVACRSSESSSQDAQASRAVYSRESSLSFRRGLCSWPEACQWLRRREPRRLLCGRVACEARFALNRVAL